MLFAYWTPRLQVICHSTQMPMRFVHMQQNRFAHGQDQELWFIELWKCSQIFELIALRTTSYQQYTAHDELQRMGTEDGLTYRHVFELIIGFLELVQPVTTSKAYAVTVPRTSHITQTHASSQPVSVSISKNFSSALTALSPANPSIPPSAVSRLTLVCKLWTPLGLS
jgi:hypothetical protein